MLTHKAQWIHRRESSFCSVTITWRRGCHRAGEGCSAGPLVWNVNKCVSPSTTRACSAQNGVHCAVLLEGLRLTNGKCSLSPSPKCCFAVQIYRYGYNADL